MKKFTFKGVLDGFRQTVQPQAIRQEQEVQESLKTEHFALRKVIIISNNLFLIVLILDIANNAIAIVGVCFIW